MHITYAWARNDEKSVEKFYKELNHSVESFGRLYYAIFQLLLDVQHQMQYRIDQKRDKYLPTDEELHPNMRFIENPILLAIAESDDYNANIGTDRNIWNDAPELVKNLTTEIVGSEFFTKYMEKDEVEKTDHKEVLLNIICEIFAESDNLFERIEEKSVYWNDDIELVLSMNIRTIERVKGNMRVRFMSLYKNQSDKDFISTLFRKTVLNYEGFQKTIMAAAKNWDIERIAIMDRVIMALALTELNHFPEIPVRVTLNEYIDMAKFYSTEKSSTFVNGVLDKILAQMKQENSLNKVDGAVFDRKNPKNQ